MKRLFFFLSLGIMIPNCLMAYGGIKIDNTTVEAGKTVEFTYDASSSKLKGKNELHGFAYTYENYKWIIYDLELACDGRDIWKGSFSVPHDAGLVAFKFQHTLSLRDQDVDTSPDFVFCVYDKKGKPMPGSQIGKAVFLCPSVMTVPGYIGVKDYFDDNYLEPDAKEILALIENEKKYYAKNRNKYFYEEVNLYKKVHGNDAEKYIQDVLSTIRKQKELNEDAWFNLQYAYLFLLNDQETSKQIEETMLEKFPYGRIARRKAMDIPFRVKGKEYFELTDKIRKEYPIMEFYRNRDFQGYIFQNFYRRLAQELFENGEYERLEEVMREMNSSMLEDAFIHQPKQWMKFPEHNPHDYYDIAMKYIEEMRRKVDFIGNLEGAAISRRQSISRNQENLGFYTTIMAELARRTGHFETALRLMDEIPESKRFNYDPAGNEAYVHCADTLGLYDKALVAVKESAAHNKLTPYLMGKLKDYYLSLKEKPAISFDEYLYSLKTEEARAEIMAGVKSGLVSDAFTPFDVVDILGNKVCSSDFSEDDIVVLDFWATWCAPCCAALVGMQMAVEKYLSDPHVKFYFVDTQDRATKEILERYWEEKGYHDMPIIIDQNSPGTKDGAKMYRDMFPSSSGIPQKAVLKNGRIRYRASGYMGSPSALMDEISAIVELLKNENKGI